MEVDVVSLDDHFVEQDAAELTYRPAAHGTLAVMPDLKLIHAIAD
jgi:hypothetical protein